MFDSNHGSIVILGLSEIVERAVETGRDSFPSLPDPSVEAYMYNYAKMKGKPLCYFQLISYFSSLNCTSPEYYFSCFCEWNSRKHDTRSPNAQA